MDKEHQDLQVATPSADADPVSPYMQTASMRSMGLGDFSYRTGEQLVNLLVAYNCVCLPEIKFSTITTAIESDDHDGPSVPKLEFETEPHTLFVGYDCRSRYVPHSGYRRHNYPITATITSSLTPDGKWNFQLTDYYMEDITGRRPYTHQPTFEPVNWQIVYLDGLRPGINQVVDEHNLKVLGWWARKVARSDLAFEELDNASRAIGLFTEAKKVVDQMGCALKTAFPVPQPLKRAG